MVERQVRARPRSVEASGTPDKHCTSHTGELAWIQYNRGRASQPHGLGELLAGLARRIREEDGGFSRKAARALEDVVDCEFREHCTVGGIAGGTIAIYVDEPGLVGPMRLRWANALVTKLQGARLGRRVERVMFRHGCAGIKVTR